jgi:hypothetical protein
VARALLPAPFSFKQPEFIARPNLQVPLISHTTHPQFLRGERNVLHIDAITKQGDNRCLPLGEIREAIRAPQGR